MTTANKKGRTISADSWRQRVSVLQRELQALQDELAACDEPETATAAARGDATAEARILELERKRVEIGASIAAKSAVLRAAGEELNQATLREDAERRAAAYDADVTAAAELAELASDVVDQIQAAARVAHQYMKAAEQLARSDSLKGLAPDRSRIFEQLRSALQSNLGVYAASGFGGGSSEVWGRVPVL